MTRSRARSIAFAALLVSAAFAAGCSAESGEDEGADVDQAGTDAALIHGRVASPGQFPGTLFLRTGCTAAKIGPKAILTAAHCVYDASAAGVKRAYANGRTIELSQDPSAGFRQAVVAETRIHPAWVDACGRTYCAASAVTAELDAPDVAVILLERELDGVPTAAVDTTRLDPGDRVTVLGFGCEDGVLVPDDRTTKTLSYAETRIAAASRVAHEGSFVTSADTPRVDSLYAVTLGPGAAKARAGLCPGDSGGPLLRRKNGGYVVVGVNANYTLDGREEAGMPVTNWHTRLDDGSKHDVGTFVRASAR